MNKLKDIYRELSDKIDLRVNELKISLNNLSKKNTNPIYKKLDYLDFIKKRKIVINVLVKNIDSIIKNNIKDINLKDKKKNSLYYKEYISKKLLKYKLLYKMRKYKFLFPRKIYKYLFFISFLSFILLWNKVLLQWLISSSYSNIIELKNSDFNDIEWKVNWIKFKLLLSKVLYFPISYIDNEKVYNVWNIIDWWIYLTNAIKIPLNLMDNFEELKDNKWIEWINYLYFLKNSKEEFFTLHNYLYKALIKYNSISDLGDKNLNSKLWDAKNKLLNLYNYLDLVVKNYDSILSLLWEYSEKKYLILFQNNDEIRSTWGFIGSLWFITVQKWEVVNIETKDIYAVEWQINKKYIEKENPPEWINKITETFWLRDSNYYISYSASSNKIKEFLSYADINIDWIIYINQNVILDLIDSVWWVNSKILDKEINKDNFSLIISTLVEAKVFKEGILWTPKQILFDFWYELLENIKTKWNYNDIANIFLKHIKSRDIVFYSFDTEANNVLWRLWLNWYFDFNSTLDYNYPVFTNIWWNKTDRYINYNFNKSIYSVDNSCDYNVKLEILKSHHFSKIEDDKVSDLLDSYWVTDKTDILNIQWRGDNYSYTRIVLPKDIELELKEWWNLYKYDDFNVLELYILTRKLETSKTIINYKLINNNCNKYTYKFYKQSWINNYNINFDINGEELKYPNIFSDFILQKNIN